MLIGVPKEIKNHEYRVGLTPASVKILTNAGHEVIVETNAGSGSGMLNDDYEKAGATIVENADAIFDRAEMVIKVKEPQASEWPKFKENQVIFTYLHLAPDHAQTQGLMDSKCIAIAYDTVTNPQGRLPLLAPMSEVAGRMSIQVGASALEKSKGGCGVLLGGVSGVEPANVVVIGGGFAGSNAIRMAMGLEANVTVIDNAPNTLAALQETYGPTLKTVISTPESIQEHLFTADLIVGSVLIPGASAPKLVTRETVKNMKPGAVMVDIAIDQGGCFETSRPTTHENPTYIEHDVVHYCVTNMPGAVPRTSTMALNHATLPFVLEIANKGYKQALLDNTHLRDGLNVCRGQLTIDAVAKEQGRDYVEAQVALA